LSNGNGALSHIKVLDFTQVILGPSATAVLADHGADVIKVERPGSGELARAFGPFLDGVGLSYAALNRNKRSIAVNLKSKEGLELVLRLADESDVVINNFRPGVMESLGLGYEDLKKRNPKIIYAVGTGFGTSGPLAESRKPGHETVAQALTGAMAANADDNGVPRRIAMPVSDMTAGNLTVQGILMALIAREQNGVGQQVEVSLLDGMLWMQAWQYAGAANPLPPGTPQHGGNPLDGGIYRTTTRYIVVTGLFKANPLGNICEALEIDDLSTDPRFDSEENLSHHATELHDLLQARLEQKSAEQWVPILESFDVITAPILDYKAAIEEEQIIHNNMIVETSNGAAINHKHVGVPVKMSGTPGSVVRGAPGVGQDTVDVLTELGLDSDEIAQLEESGAIATGDAI
jgi:crotonobetainyl-CoA:carnitine CoA-transferase CaiB-like acyl-CoA transferase